MAVPAWGSLAPQAGAVLHYVLELGGMAIGALIYWRAGNARTQPADRLTRLGVLAGAALGAAIGARALYLWQYWPALAGQPPAVWLGGKTVVGGLLGGLAGVEVAKRLLGWRASTGDGFVAPLVVAMVLGRIGCQFSGLQDLTYGTVTSLPWGWDHGDGLPRHPTSLYEILGLGLLALLLRRMRTQPAVGVAGDAGGASTAGHAGWQPGDRFRVFLAGYLLLRFALEFLKPPFGPVAVLTTAAGHAPLLAPARWAGLSAIQWACIAGLLYYVSGFLRRTRR